MRTQQGSQKTLQNRGTWREVRTDDDGATWVRLICDLTCLWLKADIRNDKQAGVTLLRVSLTSHAVSLATIFCVVNIQIAIASWLNNPAPFGDACDYHIQAYLNVSVSVNIGGTFHGEEWTSSVLQHYWLKTDFGWGNDQPSGAKHSFINTDSSRCTQASHVFANSGF